MSEIDLACHVGPWGQDNIVQAITEIADTGFQGVECPDSVVRQYEDRLHVFEEILEISDLKLAGLIQGLDLLARETADEQVERAVNSARFASASRARTLTVFHAAEFERNMIDEEWATLGAVLEEIGERCSEFAVDVCFLPRAMHLVCKEKEIKRLLASTDPKFVNLALDTAEISLAGGSPQRILRGCFDRVKLVRFRDASASKRKPKTTSDKFGSTPQFGRGAVKFDAVSKVLLENGYDGWIVVDLSGEGHAPIEAASNAFRFLMRKSGLFPF